MRRMERKFLSALKVARAVLILLALGVMAGLSVLLWKVHPLLILLVALPAAGSVAALVWLKGRLKVEPGLPQVLKHGDLGEVRSFREWLVRSGELEAGERARVGGVDGGVEELKEIFAGRLVRGDELIKQSAVLAGASTAISQNGVLDALGVLVINGRMVHRLGRTLLVELSLWQQVKLFTAIGLAALAAEQMEELQIEELAGQLAASLGLGVAGSLPGLGKVAASMTQGAANSFVTLRIGYLAKEMLCEGGLEVTDELRRRARRAAIRELPSVMQSGVAQVPKMFFKRLTSWFTG